MSKRINSSANIDRDMSKAMRKAVRKMYKEPLLVATEESAGFILPPRTWVKGLRAGLQVFVKVARFDEALLKEHAETGGLLIYATPRQIKKLMSCDRR